MSLRKIVIAIIVVLVVMGGIFVLGSAFTPKTQSIGAPLTPAPTAPIKSTS